jgi:hypothetical protein
MATIDNLDDEQEPNTEAEGAEGEKKETKPAPQDNSAATMGAINKLTNAVQTLVQNSSTKAVTTKNVSQVELAIQGLIAEGYKPDQLEAVVRLVGGVKADLEQEYEGKLREAEGKQTKQSLDSECHSRAEKALSELVSKDIDDDTKHFLISKMYKLMNSGDEFEASRHAYSQGRAPAAQQFEKVAALVLRFAPSEFVKSKDGTKTGGSQQLDTGNSRPRPSAAISKDGKSVDVDKLDQVEKEIYLATLNSTKNKDIALEALKTLAPHFRK